MTHVVVILLNVYYIKISNSRDTIILNHSFTLSAHPHLKLFEQLTDCIKGCSPCPNGDMRKFNYLLSFDNLF